MDTCLSYEFATEAGQGVILQHRYQTQSHRADPGLALLAELANRVAFILEPP